MQKQYFYILLSLCMLHTIEAHSQQVDGSVHIRSLKLEKADTELCLSFEVWIDRQAINLRQSWTITPELISAGQTESILFPGLLVNGRQKERHYKRKINFENTELLDNLPVIKTHIVNHTDTTLAYVSRIPYEEWMDNSSLQLNQLLTSSRNKKQLFVIEDCKRLQLPPEPEPEPEPEPIIPEPEIIIEERTLQASARFDYPVGDATLHPGYRNNPRELRSIQEEFGKIKGDSCAEIVAIHLRGYASPEGSYALNERLARERVSGFKEYLVKWENIPPELIHVTSIAEDWEGFRTIIESKNISGKKEILAIIECEATPDEKEKQLRRHPQWNTLVKEVFPELRRTEYQIDILIKHTKT